MFSGMELACIWIVPFWFLFKSVGVSYEKGEGLDGPDFRNGVVLSMPELLALHIIQHYQKECITVYTLCPMHAKEHVELSMYPHTFCRAFINRLPCRWTLLRCSLVCQYIGFDSKAAASMREVKMSMWGKQFQLSILVLVITSPLRLEENIFSCCSRTEAGIHLLHFKFFCT